ncbi:Twinfilin-1 [Aspergillus melleus]|uniref:Twinfilin-1 n=1 Tax=Aspergillus melleus TaxID=138277 RepID=UPI001E8DA2A6|nr:Twinfilin-1 [Aspergillus melleus]KAH8429426.1 Twinfilin-1 [Aspergillus melleus]
MQSGISVSPELHNAFNRFTSDSSLFCLPVTITNESLAPLSPIPFSAPNAFYPSLSQLNSVLEPKTPIYLLLRRPEAGSSSLIALTYIPSNAGVRAKTLFASTRATLARELGTEKFASTIFATEEEEVVGEGAWKERDAEKNGSGAGGFQREDLMGEKERELEAVRRAEEEARNGTPSRDIGIGGSFARGSGGNSPFGGGNRALQMPVDEDAKEALRSLQQGGLVQLVGFLGEKDGGRRVQDYLIKMANFYGIPPHRSLISPRRLSDWVARGLALTPTPSRNRSRPRHLAILSTTIPTLKQWSSSIPVRPDRRSRSACCTPVLDCTPFNSPRTRV